MITISRVDFTRASQATGVVIVIDVIRAFSVAGYAFACGAQRLWLVRSVEEARKLREREPEALLIGEVGGRLIPGFDLNNSPARMAETDVQGRLLIQRTGAGTQGAVNASRASSTLLCALTNAQATAQYVREMTDTTEVTLLPTATTPEQGEKNEDDICADYLEALLRGQTDAEEILARGVTYLENSGRFDAWTMGLSDFPAEDIPAVLAANSFPFAMIGQQQEWQGIRYVDVRRVNL